MNLRHSRTKCEHVLLRNRRQLVWESILELSLEHTHTFLEIVYQQSRNSIDTEVITPRHAIDQIPLTADLRAMRSQN